MEALAKDGILHIPQSSGINRASTSDWLVTYLRHSWVGGLTPLQRNSTSRLGCWIPLKICCHSDSCERPPAENRVKNSPGVKYEVYTISFQTFFVWALLLSVQTWNSRPLRSNLFRLQCTCIVTTSGIPQGRPLVWACQWPSSQPLSSPQLSHNDSLWA